MILSEHVHCAINGDDYELIYFGKAGGITKKGKVTNQGLNGRINNVVGAKSIKRAIYWNTQMLAKNISSITVFYCCLDQPQIFEAQLYDYLKKNKLDYPMLNAKRGRPKGKGYVQQKM